MKKLYISNKDESVRMFKKDWMETLSKVHWSVPIILFGPVIIWSIYSGLTKFDYTILQFAGYFLLGLFSWSLAEYVMHRFVFHYEPKSKFGQRLHFIMHGVHHDYPNDSRRLVLPPSMSIPLSIAFYFLFKALFNPFFFYPFFAGFILGYVSYDTIHYAIHHANFKGKFWKALKTHHIMHHYTDDERGYGVSSPLWDLIIGSGFEKKNLIKSKSNEPTHSEAIKD